MGGLKESRAWFSTDPEGSPLIPSTSGDSSGQTVSRREEKGSAQDPVHSSLDTQYILVFFTPATMGDPEYLTCSIVLKFIGYGLWLSHFWRVFEP